MRRGEERRGGGADGLDTGIGSSERAFVRIPAPRGRSVVFFLFFFFFSWHLATALHWFCLFFGYTLPTALLTIFLLSGGAGRVRFPTSFDSRSRERRRKEERERKRKSDFCFLPPLYGYPRICAFSWRWRDSRWKDGRGTFFFLSFF